MQTFMPSDNFVLTAEVLDNQRLNKQALEGWQIMMTNLGLDPEGNRRAPKGWFNHPAVRMWRGSESALLEYIGAMVDEWKRRGYRSTIYEKALRTHERGIELGLVRTTERPAWMEDKALLERLMSSHRTALLCKNYAWYSQFGWSEDSGVEPNSYEYVWATTP